MFRRRFEQSHRGFRKGLGIAEACISLAICAALLTAVAAAFRAAGDAVNENDEFFTATQGARVALNRMLTQVRRGTPGQDSTSTNLHLLTDTGLDVSYNYQSSTRQLKLVTSSSTILVHDASTCAFAYTLGTDSGGLTCVSKVTVTIGVSIGNNSILLTGSACPRRSLSY
jgi:hypothetical protein